MPTATAPDAVLSDLQKSITDLQERARKHIAALDQRIHAITLEQSELKKKVPRDAFVAKILDDVRAQSSFHADMPTRLAKTASSLGAHAELRTLASVNGAGKSEFKVTTPSRLNIFGHDTPALALIGTFPELFEPALEAWAHRLADELELPTTGSVDKLHADHERLQAELERLDAERAKARDQLSNLIEVSGTPHLEDDAWLRLIGKAEPAFEPMPKETGRPAGVYDGETGEPKAAIGSDAWREYWARRHADEAEEEAIESRKEAAVSGRSV